MKLSLTQRLLMSLRSPYLWMVRGVILLSALLYTPWMLCVLPLSELIIQTWFGNIFKARLESENGDIQASGLRDLGEEDVKWYQHITECLAEVRDRLPMMEYAPQVEVDALAQDVLRRLVSLRRAQILDEKMSASAIAKEVDRTKKAIEAEKSEKIREVLVEQKNLQEQRLELKERLNGRVRELGAQLKLLAAQVEFLRDTVLSSEVQQGNALNEDAQSALKDQIDILNRQMRVCSDLDDEVRTMLKTGTASRLDREQA